MDNLKITNDFVFKKIFGKQENEVLLKDLLTSILNISIQKIQIKSDVVLEKVLEENKTGILDIQAMADNNKLVNIEIQVKDEYNIKERSLYYWSAMYHNGLGKGNNYKEGIQTIAINILNFNCFEDGPYHEIGRIKRDYNNEIVTDKLELHFIQIPKFREKGLKIESNLDAWMHFINNENKKGVELAMKKNNVIKKAAKELEYLSGDEEIRRIAFLREKAIMDEYNNISSAKEEGLKEGIEKGIEKGMRQRNIQIARKMIEQKIDIKTIANITGLTIEEIQQL